MPVSVAPAVAVAVIAANAAATSANNSRAHDSACTAMLQTFNSPGSTAQQRREYVSCVDRMEPLPSTPEEEAHMKVVVGGLLAIAFIGAIIGYSTAESSYDDPGMRAFAGFFLAPIGTLVAAGFITLLHWLFT